MEASASAWARGRNRAPLTGYLPPEIAASSTSSMSTSLRRPTESQHSPAGAGSGGIPRRSRLIQRTLIAKCWIFSGRQTIAPSIRELRPACDERR